MAIHPEIQEIINTLVDLIRKGEALVNVVDRGMILARRFERGTASDVSVGDIPSPVSRDCTYDDDASFMAYVDNDNIGAGCQLANLAVDQIRAEDEKNGTSTPVTAEEWFDHILAEFKRLGESEPASLQYKDDDYPNLVISNSAADYLCRAVEALPYYKRYELSQVSNGLLVLAASSRAKTWLHPHPEGKERSESAEAAEAGILRAVYAELSHSA